ncbi:MAG: hypothetical protein ACRCR9_01400 [Chitinophagaceae bacterium]
MEKNIANLNFHKPYTTIYIHPEWDNFSSETLFLKILFVDYKNIFSL